MSEVIVRMEMPTGCANCPMADDDSRFCKAAKEYIPMLGKPSWCPIVGVLPDEHGDLIDRDETFHAAQPQGCTDEHWAETTLGRVVLGAKTVIAAERKDDEKTAD